MDIKKIYLFRIEKSQKWDGFLADMISILYLSRFGYPLFFSIFFIAFIVNYLYSKPLTAFAYIPCLVLHLIFGIIHIIDPQRHLYVLYTEVLNLLFALALLFNIQYNFLDLGREVASINILILGSITLLLTFISNPLIVTFKILATILTGHILISYIPTHLRAEWTIALYTGVFFGTTLLILQRTMLMMLFFFKETETKSREHSYRQMSKMVFPHQMELMKASYDLKSTMPVDTKTATVLTFDIQGSSKASIALINEIINNIIAGLESYFMENYTHAPLMAPYFLIKELGDGFILSIGHPFETKRHPSIEAFDLAIKIQNMFTNEVTSRGERLFSSIGISDGDLTTYFTKGLITNYESYGKAIILSNRYESYRKILFKDLCSEGNIIIIRSSVFTYLLDHQKEHFERYDISTRIRDDVFADHLYYLVSNANSNMPASSVVVG